jgi:hypothetical protein
MLLDYKSKKYHPWVNLALVKLERKLQYETAFDGIVKIYSVRSYNDKVNLLFENKFFGDFIHSSNTGAFFRMFINKKSWPMTVLIYIDFDIPSLTEIKKTSSTWNVWTGADLGYGKHSIKISPTEKIEYQIGK